MPRKIIKYTESATRYCCNSEIHIMVTSTGLAGEDRPSLEGVRVCLSYNFYLVERSMFLIILVTEFCVVSDDQN
jgi:hypothetical protein